MAGLVGLVGLAFCRIGRFLVPKPAIWEAWWLHFGIPRDHFGDPGVPRETPEDTLGSRPRFLSIWDGFGDPLGTLFEVMLVTFSWFGTPKWQIGFQVRFFCDSGVEITPKVDAWMCLNHSKYCGFDKVSLFQLISDLWVLRDGWGPHFGRFFCVLGRILVVWEGPWDGLEF